MDTLRCSEQTHKFDDTVGPYPCMDEASHMCWTISGQWEPHCGRHADGYVQNARAMALTPFDAPQPVDLMVGLEAECDEYGVRHTTDPSRCNPAGPCRPCPGCPRCGAPILLCVDREQMWDMAGMVSRAAKDAIKAARTKNEETP